MQTYVASASKYITVKNGCATSRNGDSDANSTCSLSLLPTPPRAMSCVTFAPVALAHYGTASRRARSQGRAGTVRVNAGDRVDGSRDPDCESTKSPKAPTSVSSVSRRSTLGLCAIAPTVALLECFTPFVNPANAEYQTSNEYMPSLEGKDYGKSKYVYPDFVQKFDGALQYKTMKEGTGSTMTVGKKAVIDWDGYTLGYYGRPFEARNKSKGGAFTGDDKDFVRFTSDDQKIIPAFREAVLGMKAGEIRRVIVAGGSDLSYPQGRKWKTMGPQPSNFSGERALGFVLENEGMIDKTLLFDIELIRVDEK